MEFGLSLSKSTVYSLRGLVKDIPVLKVVAKTYNVCSVIFG